MVIKRISPDQERVQNISHTSDTFFHIRHPLFHFCLPCLTDCDITTDFKGMVTGYLDKISLKTERRIFQKLRKNRKTTKYEIFKFLKVDFCG